MLDIDPVPTTHVARLIRLQWKCFYNCDQFCQSKQKNGSGMASQASMGTSIKVYSALMLNNWHTYSLIPLSFAPFYSSIV